MGSRDDGRGCCFGVSDVDGYIIFFWRGIKERALK